MSMINLGYGVRTWSVVAGMAMAVASGCIVQTGDDDDGAGGNAGTGGSGAGAPADASQLFVVNNNAELTSYRGALSLDGEEAPTTRLSLGASTSLFQPRAAVLTETGRLLVARQNGGIVGYDEGASADGETPASVVVEGAGTGLDTPIAFAYAGASDTLYVGGPQMDEGVLVFSAVSSAAFDGEVAPARSFGPSDRAPHDATGTIEMSVDALVLDGSGRLFLSDTSGEHVNNSRVLFYEAPQALDGAAEPDAVITSVAWGTIEDMAIDADGTLYVVNASDTVFVYDAASQLEGEVQPSRTIRVAVGGASIKGVLVAPSGLGFVADDENHAIHSFEDFANLSSEAAPHRTLDGFETRLRNPRKMFLVTP